MIIPASNEAALIGACLQGVLNSRTPQALRVIVAANGCHDNTADIARGFADKMAARGWTLLVLEQDRGHKPSALNAADAVCGPGARLYLDADVIVSPQLIQQIYNILDIDSPVYTSGVVHIPQSRSWVSRAYARIYRQVPFMTNGVPGCGLFAVNPAGRALWSDFPDIIADDTFVRLTFTPDQRVQVPAPYDWPVVEGWRALLKVRRRQNAGVREVAAKFPHLIANDDKPPLGSSRTLAMALRDPIGFAIYATIGLLARRSDPAQDWSRGR
ncbi:MAG TPA: glycosyltransferase [Aliiroseovarius sp.]|nr:glycosyltransferase [Aliiroseovarius sp.]